MKTKIAHWNLTGRSFTLVELLIVVAIIAVLAGMLLPALKAAIEKSRSMSCLNNLKQTSQAMAFYSLDHKDYVLTLTKSGSPWTTQLKNYGYVKTIKDKYLRCPSLRPVTATETYSQYKVYGSLYIRWDNEVEFFKNQGFGNFVMPYSTNGVLFYTPQMKKASELPHFADTVDLNTAPIYAGSYMLRLRGDGSEKELQSFHHNKESNVVFFDGHALSCGISRMKSVANIGAVGWSPVTF